MNEANAHGLKARSMVAISGRSYPERPPSKKVSGSAARRIWLIVDSLKCAAEFCSETERRLYKDILEVLAHAENLQAQRHGESLGQISFSDLMKHECEP